MPGNIKSNLICVLMLFFFASFLSVSAKEYSLASMDEGIYIYSNGNVHVNESISYHFSGCWHEVYREISLHGMLIENIEIYCEGAYCRSEKSSDESKVSISGFLYPDEKSAVNELCDRDVVLHINYDLTRVIKVYNDSSEFHYKLWGEEWDRSLGLLNAKIYLPKGVGNISYWLHSEVKGSAVYNPDERLLDVRAPEIPEYSYFEVRIVMPKEWFNVDDEGVYEKVWVIQNEGLHEIIKAEEDYKTSETISMILSILIPLIFVSVAVLVPFLIYFRYGREPRIDYKGIYERELPYDDPPAVVNAVMQGRVGKPSMDAFTSTIMDLARRGYIKISTEKKDVKELFIFSRMKEGIVIEFTDKSKSIVGGSINKNKNESEHEPDEGNQKIDFFGFNLMDFIKFDFFGDNKITKIKINKNIGKKKNDLIDFEYYSLVFLAGFSEKKDDKDVVLWHNVEKELENKTVARWFLEFYGDWKDLVESRIKMNEIFIPKGDTYLKIYGVSAIIVAFFVIVFAVSSFSGTLAETAVISCIILGLSGLISLILPEKIGGRWTPEGRAYYEKWKAFEHFITDFSRIKQYPPESVIVWEHFIVYAAALGIAEKVIENMNLILPKEEIEHLGVYAYPAIPSTFSRTFNSGISTATAGSGGAGGGFGGGVGGAGGGFGGGGGGAR